MSVMETYEWKGRGVLYMADARASNTWYVRAWSLPRRMYPVIYEYRKEFPEEEQQAKFWAQAHASLPGGVGRTKDIATCMADMRVFDLLPQLDPEECLELLLHTMQSDERYQELSDQGKMKRLMEVMCARR